MSSLGTPDEIRLPGIPVRSRWSFCKDESHAVDASSQNGPYSAFALTTSNFSRSPTMSPMRAAQFTVQVSTQGVQAQKELFINSTKINANAHHRPATFNAAENSGPSHAI